MIEVAVSCRSAALRELCSHHGILVRRSMDTYAFGHFALQEYLVGKWYSNEQRWTSLLSRAVATSAASLSQR